MKTIKKRRFIPGKHRPPKAPKSAEINAAIKVRFDEGKRVGEIARELGRTSQSVRRRLTAMGLEFRVRTVAKPWREPPKKSPALERLENDVVRPGIEEKLIPLLAYRGNVTLGRCQQLWNHAILMMHAEAPAAYAGKMLAHNPDYSQLCGPQKPLRDSRALAQFFWRLRDNPEVTDNISGLTDYVEWYWSNENWRYGLGVTPVSMERARAGRGAWWRTWDVAKHEAERRRRQEARQRAKDSRDAAMFYPYLIHETKQDSEHELLTLVNNAVPKHLPESIRADLCQDLIVAVLSGEIDKSELKNEVQSYTKKVFKMFPTKYGPLSLDAPAPWGGDDDRPLYETLGDVSFH